LVKRQLLTLTSCSDVAGVPNVDLLRHAARIVASAAARLGVPILHLSTGCVFDGKKESPYIETDTVPETVYGRSKLEGEHAVAAANQRHIILRTAWVYSPFGKNIARTMHRRLHLTTLPKPGTAPMVS
jgi:dTDP-4-dehydrorhamnose reductase